MSSFARGPKRLSGRFQFSLSQTKRQRLIEDKQGGDGLEEG
jgi:hypothetical protein